MVAIFGHNVFQEEAVSAWLLTYAVSRVECDKWPSWVYDCQGRGPGAASRDPRTVAEAEWPDCDHEVLIDSKVNHRDGKTQEAKPTGLDTDPDTNTIFFWRCGFVNIHYSWDRCLMKCYKEKIVKTKIITPWNHLKLLHHLLFSLQVLKWNTQLT